MRHSQRSTRTVEEEKRPQKRQTFAGDPSAAELCAKAPARRGEQRAVAGDMEVVAMLTPSLLLALAAALGALALAALPLAAAWRWWRRRARAMRLLRAIPGPFSPPLLGSTVAFLGVRREDFFTVMIEITRRYLPTMLFWRSMQPEVHLTRPEDLEVILGSLAYTYKSGNYEFLRPWLGDGILLSKGKKWHSRKKLITPTLHLKILESFLDAFVEKSLVLVKVLKEELGNTEGFDVFGYASRCTLDIICETAMGVQLNTQQNRNSKYLNAVLGAADGAIGRILRPWLHSDFIFYRSSRGKYFTKCVTTIHNFQNKVIHERKRQVGAQGSHDQKHEEEKEESTVYGARRRLAFLDLLLAASRDGAALSDDDIREEVATFMLGGNDTIAVAISWALCLLGAHRDVQNKAMEELEAIFQGTDRPPTMQDLAEMKYLESIIKETLRLYPSIPFITRNLKEDLKLDEYTIPAGTDVAVPIFHVHRNAKYFPNPEKFDPDNFLPERVQGRHPYAYIPFSAGPRNCVGQRFAMLEIKVLLSTLLRNYEAEAVTRPEGLKLIRDLTLRPARGFQLRLHARGAKRQ